MVNQLRTSGVFNLGSLGGDGPDAVLDADFDSVILLLDGDGTNNQTSFTDLSSVQTPITTFGNTHVDTSVKKFGSGSIEFDGNGDYLRTSDFGLTSGDFTIEAWVQLKAMPTSDSWPATWYNWMIIAEVGSFNASDGWQFRIGQTQLAFGTNGDTTAVTGTHGMSTGTWYHLAVTRSGNVYTLYVDGSSVGSATYTTQQPGSGAYGFIGGETGQGAYLNGYIDDLRITKGVARYSSSFTPPTAALPTTDTGSGAIKPTRKWGGLVGRSLIASDELVKTGVLKLSELLQASYPAPGAPAWSPANITTYAWFDGDDNTTIYTDTGKTTNATNGQDVQLWADKSGNSRDIQKIGTSNVPNYNSSGLNSKGVLQSNVYDGLEHQLSTNFTSGDWEIYTVVKVNNAAGGADNYGRIMAFGATGNDYNNTSAFIPLYYSNVAGNFQSWQLNAGGPTVGGYTNGTFRLISARSDSGTAYISADGGTESTSSKTFTANATGFRLFAPVQYGIGANLTGAGLASDAFLDGAIAELVFISGNLSSTDKQKLEGYLSHKWGLEGNLPSGHPYKTQAPQS